MECMNFYFTYYHGVVLSNLANSPPPPPPAPDLCL